MRKTPWIAGAALAATLAVTAYAQDMHDGPPKTRAELRAKIDEMFRKADTNGDGYVTKAEFDAAREAMKAKFAERREEHRAKMFAMLDANHDGLLSKDEFMARPPREAMAGHEGPRMGMRMRHGTAMGRGDRWFDRADANHDGKITLAEAEAGPLAMFDRADTNHDGTISPEEEKAAHEAMRAKWKDRHAGGQD